MFARIPISYFPAAGDNRSPLRNTKKHRIRRQKRMRCFCVIPCQMNSATNRNLQNGHLAAHARGSTTMWGSWRDKVATEGAILRIQQCATPSVSFADSSPAEQGSLTCASQAVR